MKREQTAWAWQPPGWSPPGAVAFLHALLEGERLGEWTRAKPDDGWADWLHRQGLAPYAWHQLKVHRQSGALPPQVAQALRTEYYRAVADAQLHTAELRGVLSCLEQAGITPVLFKGAALAYTSYPDPACRPMDDLDLWVDQQTMAAARSALCEIGYRERENSKRPLELQRQTSGEVQLVGAVPGQGLVELHWGTFAGEWPRRTAVVAESEIRDRAVRIEAGGCRALALSPEDSVLQLAVHLAVGHQMSYPGLRGLLDIALLDRTATMNWADVTQRARAWRVSSCTWLALALTAEVFGLPGAEQTIEALAPSRLRRWLLRQFVDSDRLLEGRKMSRGRERLAFQLLLVDQPASAARLVARTLWPERNWLRARYGKAGWSVRIRHFARAAQGRV